MKTKFNLSRNDLEALSAISFETSNKLRLFMRVSQKIGQRCIPVIGGCLLVYFLLDFELSEVLFYLIAVTLIISYVTIRVIKDDWNMEVVAGLKERVPFGEYSFNLDNTSLVINTPTIHETLKFPEDITINPLKKYLVINIGGGRFIPIPRREDTNDFCEQIWMKYVDKLNEIIELV